MRGHTLTAETKGTNIVACAPLITPEELWAQMPLEGRALETVARGREQIQRILDGKDHRKILIVGPCSIHDPEQALEYARRLKHLADEVEDTMLVVMRVYFEKPRTTVGWKGLINDPRLDGSFDIETGIRVARRLLIDLSEMGVLAATETLDPIIPKYLAGIVSWTSIGARTTESQTHRELASGLSMPVGFKNGTDGNVDIAINALKSSREPHSFVGVDEKGQTAVYRTRGNRYGHVVLRGGKAPNYDAVSVESVMRKLAQQGLPSRVVIDCSHGNSSKDHRRQPEVLRDVVSQIVDGNEGIVGMMLESHLCEGSQPLCDDLSGLKRGVSITDKCISWEMTEQAVHEAHEALRARHTLEQADEPAPSRGTRTVTVASGDGHQYDVIIGSGLFARIASDLARSGHSRKTLVVADSTTAALFGEQLLGELQNAGVPASLHAFPAGEASKTLATYEGILAAALAAGLERDSCIVALGGGVVGDIAGFAASTYMRGIRAVQVPTTLLAQVDSSVGGKTGVNLRGRKNVVGTFHHAAKVYCDSALLRHLPERERRSGLGEAIKHGCILDERFFAFLERHVPQALALDEGCLAVIVERSCLVKAGVVREDAREAGLRKILNFGHTIGHAIELMDSEEGHAAIAHGECVALGMAVEARLSERLGILSAKERSRIEALVHAMGMRTRLPSHLDIDEIIVRTRSDKKASGALARYVLLKRVGEVHGVLPVEEEIVREVLEECREERA